MVGTGRRERREESVRAAIAQRALSSANPRSCLPDEAGIRPAGVWASFILLHTHCSAADLNG